MKNNPHAYPVFLTVFMLSGLMLVLGSCSGCSTAREVSYKTLAATANTVDVAMKAYADARVAGKVDDITHAKVVDIKKRYETAFLAAATAAQANLENPSPSELITIATQLVEAINSSIKKSP